MQLPVQQRKPDVSHRSKEFIQYYFNHSLARLGITRKVTVKIDPVMPDIMAYVHDGPGNDLEAVFCGVTLKTCTPHMLRILIAHESLHVSHWHLLETIHNTVTSELEKLMVLQEEKIVQSLEESVSRLIKSEKSILKEFKEWKQNKKQPTRDRSTNAANG